MQTTENHVAALSAALNGIIQAAVNAALEAKPAAKTRPVKLEPAVAPPPTPEPEAIAAPATVTPTATTSDSVITTYTVPDVQALAGAASKVIGSAAVRDLIKDITGAPSIPAADAKTLPALAAALIAAAEGSA